MIDETTQAEAREFLQRKGERPEQTAERLVREELERLGFGDVAVTSGRVRKERGEPRFAGEVWFTCKAGGHTYKSRVEVDGLPSREAVPDALVSQALMVLGHLASEWDTHQRNQAAWYRKLAEESDGAARKAVEVRTLIIARVTAIRAAGSDP